MNDEARSAWRPARDTTSSLTLIGEAGAGTPVRRCPPAIDTPSSFFGPLCRTLARTTFKTLSENREGFGRSRRTDDVGRQRPAADSNGRAVRLPWLRESGGSGRPASGDVAGSGVWSGAVNAQIPAPARPSGQW
jgi:hypothetical protein